MTEYKELVKALRETATFTQTNGILSKRECALENLAYDAAAAIEALQAEVKRLEEDLKTREAEREVMQDTIKICEEAADRYKAQLPKRGEWILQASGQDCKCSACGAYWIPFGDEYDYKFCPNCGAKMEARE